jgi:histidine triad (HIT) family protein
MGAIFSKIIAGEIPCYKVAETDKYLAFLDIAPLKRGHTLCIPKVEVDHLFDLDAETYNGLMAFTQKVAKAIQKTLPYKRVGMVVAGFEVPHAHIHLIPVDSMDEMDFKRPKVEMVKEEFAGIAMAIQMAYRTL